MLNLNKIQKNIPIKLTNFLPVLAVFTVLGAVLLIRSFAATPGVVQHEAENATLAGAARVGSDANASGGQFLIVKASNPTPPPTPPPPPPPPTGGGAGSELQRPVKIMPVGDSITMGMYGTFADWNANKSLRGGYRAKLMELIGTKFQYDFVGSSDGIDFREQLPDKDHEGHGGWQLTGGYGGGLDSIINGKLSMHQPDVILLHAGTNDFGSGENAVTLANEMSGFIDNLTNQRPGMYVIVSGLALRDYDTNTFNSMVSNAVAQKRNAGKKVYYVDTAANWQQPYWGDDANALHPSLANYEVMGQNWFNALQTHLPGLFGGVNPTPPTPPPPMPTPPPPPPSGLKPQNGVPGTFNLEWSDEFAGSTLDANIWRFYPPWGGQFCQGEEYFTTQDYSVSGGNLNIFYRRRANPISECGITRTYNTVWVSTLGKKTVDAGHYIEFRVKPAKGNGFWNIAWIMPNDWPEPGCNVQRYEMDVFEHLGNSSNHLDMTTHTRNNCGSLNQDYVVTNEQDWTQNFHTIGLNWFSDRTEIYLNGTKRFESCCFAGFSSPGFIILNGFLGRAGDWGPGGADFSTPNEASYQIDYVRVFKRQ